ncbi:MAG: PorT family protein [Tannerellaceae bacterium]|jgi:hypothetical protein|nr:PorT family protein [Tannerellaceae bacterium]
MKKLFITTAVLLMAVGSAFAQSAQFGVKVGGNLSTVSIENGEGIKSKLGFQAGITLDYGFTENVYLLTGLEIAEKGFKISESEDGVEMTLTANPLYLTLPVHIGYKIDLEGARLVPQIGPYFSYGLAGKIKASGSVEGVDVSVDTGIDYFGDDGAKSLDIGLGVGLGIEFGKLGFNIGYDLGLTSISQDDDGSVKNGSFYLTAGYKF